ncbi:hypothetical protein FKM82_011313 [Ascaphus truei]
MTKLRPILMVKKVRWKNSKSKSMSYLLLWRRFRRNIGKKWIK